MLFARRTPPTVLARCRDALWPTAGWSRSLRYHAKRLVRLSASPHAVAVGIAAGVVVSWTPFVGLHFLLSAVLAFVLGGNLIASAIGTVIGNPITFPLMWWSSYAVGLRLLGLTPEHEPLGEILRNIGTAPFSEILPVLEPMLVGALPLGVLSGVVTYAVVSLAVRGYRKARLARLAGRRDRRLAAADEGVPSA
ncbi:MAG TPA: DUF2062 domain-containing protein [Bauldia sp.]|mgnify:CR=1 FL=1|nr:DUF2062 domain-containing protein [Bauldia sp.]